MKKTIGFHSVLAEQMQQFVAFKRMQGYDYTGQARTLSYFDRFLVDDIDRDPDIGLRLDSLRRYIETTAHLKGFIHARVGSVRYGSSAVTCMRGSRKVQSFPQTLLRAMPPPCGSTESNPAKSPT